MRIIGNYSEDWVLEKIHINPLNQCLTDKAKNTQVLTVASMVAILCDAAKGQTSTSIVPFLCKHCDASA